jgi:peptide chain release factor 3
MGVEVSVAATAADVASRRTFAIISHPDAGKTTLTEKLLLYGGAIHLAGSVKARRAERHATSDWMELEKQRGISVTSSVLQFEWAGRHINLLDTPGHQDFGEDTYRTLIAADSAIMLLDNRKGVEERTRQLFDVCRRRRIPIVTLVNKCDRAGAEPLELIGDVERDLGLTCCPMTWPVHRQSQFVGVYDLTAGVIELFDRDTRHGARRAGVERLTLDAPVTTELLGAETVERLRQEIELLSTAGVPFDRDAFLAGDQSPVFFGSALTNFGIEPFFRTFLDMAPPPGPRDSSAGPVDPLDPGFAGFVFKIQANMDPKHRDRLAFVRIVSGHFEAGMSVTHVRSGKTLRLSAPQQMMARERQAVEEASPGDVIGVHDRGTLRIGDTLTDGRTLEFSGIPRFAPEHFARIHVRDPLRRKHLDTGLRQLSDEGAAQVFYTETVAGPTPIVGAVGLLQFDVMVFRLEHEYGVPCKLDRMSFQHARWVLGPEDEIERVGRAHGRLLVYDARNNPLILFEDAWSMRAALTHEGVLTYLESAP